MPVWIAADLSGLISVTPRRASEMALPMSFETVPLRGDGISFFGPRIYCQKGFKTERERWEPASACTEEQSAEYRNRFFRP